MSQRDAEAIRPIRALLRGLETLEALNRRDGSTVGEVAQATRLPRTTVYRILETLCAGGYVVRDDGDDRYRPTIHVRGLADGFEDDAWVRDIAKPEMEALCRRILWPVMLSTFNGSDLVLRVVTDRMSPLALERYTPGSTLSLLNSPAGLMRLAAASDAERDALLDVARGDGASEREIAEAEAGAEKAAQVGYAIDLRAISGEAGVATPVRDRRDVVRGMVCMRFIRSALTADRVAAEFVPQLVELAERLGAAIPIATPETTARVASASPVPERVEPR